MTRRPINRWSRGIRAAVKAFRTEWHRTPHTVGLFTVPLYAQGGAKIDRTFIPVTNLGCVYSVTRGGGAGGGGASRGGR